MLEKAEGLGDHNLSGAVIDPRSFRELFPGMERAAFPFRRPVEREAVYLMTGRGNVRIPAPPTMRNHGNHIASICEVVRWLGERAEDAGVMILPGFPAESLLVDGRDVVGVRTAPRGLNRDGQPGGSNYMPAVDVTARVTVLSEGTRGALSQAYLEWQGVESANPQIHSLGVKELWEVERPLDRIIHTMGWPLTKDGFGGSFAYPLADNLVALGLVASLDYRDARLDVHGLLQRMKHHPLFRGVLAGGEMVEWGAKTIPEGGYHSLPERRHGGGICIVGDAAGYVDVASLKGIHYAMHSGILAARAIYAALKAGDVSEARARALHRGGGPVVHRQRPQAQPQHAAGVQERVHHGRRAGEPGDRDGRTGAGAPNRDGNGRGGTEVAGGGGQRGGGGIARQPPRRLQGRRRFQERQPDP